MVLLEVSESYIYSLQKKKENKVVLLWQYIIIKMYLSFLLYASGKGAIVVLYLNTSDLYKVSHLRKY